MKKTGNLSDAFNKGISLSSGKFIGIVNSDDILTYKSLSIIKKYINKQDFDFYFWKCKNTGVFYMDIGQKRSGIVGDFIRAIQQDFLLKMSLPKKIGKYNLKYKYHADYDYFYRMIVKNKCMEFQLRNMKLLGYLEEGAFS